MPKSLSGIFKPDAKTISGVFGGVDCHYQIPDYQRPFSWGDDQIETLWDDIYDAMVEGDESYFLGPMILVKTDDNWLEVVDGQQRLTTLTILFCVLRDLYKPDDNEILDSIKSVRKKEYRLRLITQAEHQNKFEQEILNGVDFPSESLSRREKDSERYKNAAMIFRDKLEEIDHDGQIDKFVDYLLNRVIMITIRCERRSFAVKLFQVLNTRGLDLTNADLIKSHLYGNLEDRKKRKQFMATWNDIEKTAEDVEESLESLFTYFEYYLLARNPKYTMYDELRRTSFFKKKPNTVVYETRRFFKDFQEIYDTESKLVNSFWYLPNQVFWKSILTTAKYEKFRNFNGLCKELRKFFYSYWIAGYTTSKIKQMSFRLIGLIKKGKNLNDIRKEIDKKMSNDNVLKRMKENLDNDAYWERWHKPLLILLEYEQTDDSKVTYIEIDKNLHTDHILPNGWATNAEWRKVWTKEKADKWLNKIGNLTLLSGKKNIAARNDSFRKKKGIYRGKGIDGTTAFLISQEILFKRNWTEGHVKDRQKLMVERTERLLGVKLP